MVSELLVRIPKCSRDIKLTDILWECLIYEKGDKSDIEDPESFFGNMLISVKIVKQRRRRYIGRIPIYFSKSVFQGVDEEGTYSILVGYTRVSRRSPAIPYPSIWAERTSITAIPALGFILYHSF
jgi:hypothetical protein